jgi:hypothetical protein
MKYQDAIIRLPDWLPARDDEDPPDFDDLMRLTENVGARPVECSDLYTAQEAMMVAMAAREGLVDLPAHIDIEDLVIYAENEIEGVIWNDTLGEFEPNIPI